MSRRQPAREEGFVLLAVLGLTALISALAVGLLLLARDDYRETRLFLDLARARLHADNALVRAVATLGEPGDPLHAMLLQPGTALRFEDQGVAVIVEVEHESGKLDLNRAEPAFLRAALRRVLGDEARAAAIGARVLAARGADTFIDEVRTVLSIPERFEGLEAKLAPFFTGLTGAIGVNPGLASPLLLEAIPGISAGEIAILAGRGAGRGVEAGQVLTKHRAFLAPARPVYTLKARVQDPTLPPLTRTLGLALRHLPARRRVDVGVLWWRG